MDPKALFHFKQIQVWGPLTQGKFHNWFIKSAALNDSTYKELKNYSM